VPNLRIKEWFLFDIVFSINFFILFYYFFNFRNAGLISISISYFLAYAVHLVVNFLFIRHSLSYRFIQRNLLLLISSISAIAIIFSASELNVRLGYYLLGPVFLIWLLLSVRRQELSKLKVLAVQIIQNYKRRSLSGSGVRQNGL